MVKIYHNPRCKKSIAGLSYLQSKRSDIHIIKYIEEGISSEELAEILCLLNLKPIDIVRKQEELFKKELKNKNFTQEEWLQILSKNPKLIQRPIIITEKGAIIGQTFSEIDKIL